MGTSEERTRSSDWRALPLWQKALILAAVGLTLWAARGRELNRFVTVDEVKWLTRSANFYLALDDRDFAGTFQREHPGVTITWAGTLGFLKAYPGLADDRPVEFSRPEDLERFLRKNDRQPIDLLAAGRTFVVLAVVAALTLSFPAAARLFGWLPALVGFGLLAFDPLSAGLSRLLHLDGLVSALMLLSLLSMLAYLYRGRSRLDLILSAAAAGLSWLTKSPALFLIPFFGLLALLHRPPWQNGRLSWGSLWSFIRPLVAWGLIGGLVFVLLWPAMWVDPLGTLGRVFSTATTYAVEGHDEATFFNGIVYPEGTSAWYFYPLAFLWRATPALLGGLALALILALFRRKAAFTAGQTQAVAALLLFALLFTLFMSLAEKKFERYLLPVHAPLALIAGLGYVAAGKLLVSRLRFLGSSLWRSRLVLGGSLVLLILAQAWGTLRTSPYYLTYYNPMLGGIRSAGRVMMLGWGEGLEQAGQYLSGKPQAGLLHVISWYPNGSFSYFFYGNTLNKEFGDPHDLPEEADYAVLYVHQWQLQAPNRAFLDYFAAQEPEFTAVIDGVAYAWVYALP